MNNTDLAYTAGILDGEGSITLTKRAKQNPYPVISVDSTDRELLEWLKTNFGGCIVIKKKTKDHHSQAWTWRLQQRAALSLLEKLIPFMKIDRKIYRAHLLVSEYVQCTPRNGKYTPELLLKREELYQRFIRGS